MPPQGNKYGFPQDMNGPHRGIDIESCRETDKHDNGIPTHKRTKTAIN